MLIGLNPLKRVKFISICLTVFSSKIKNRGWSQSPQTGQVYFNIIPCTKTSRKTFLSQSPQTGQVYFNRSTLLSTTLAAMSQSPQTGQVYFNNNPISFIRSPRAVSIPSNGSSLFQLRG